MRILQVKEYHNQVADIQQERALERWRETGKGYPTQNMFYFCLEDRKGYPTEKRQKGWVAFTDKGRKACFGLTKNKAIACFNK